MKENKGLSASLPGGLNFGVPGKDGATFTPSLDDDGNLSWSNDKGLQNPETKNIRGPQGPAGEVSDDKIAEVVKEYMDSSQNVNWVEPADDDIPKVYFTGTLPTSKDDGDLQLYMRYISKSTRYEYPVTLKVQGSSSANYAKKNFTLKPYKDATYENKKKLAFKNWPEMNKFVLKAHWIDHSHVRNVGTAKIWGKIVKSRSDYASLPEELRTAPNNGATDGFTVKVFANGVYQGLYEWIVPKDKLFGQDSDIVTHSILNSEWNNQPTCAFATTSPSMSGNWSEELQDSLSAGISTSFANLIKFVAGSTDEEFVAGAENYFDVQSVIDFAIFARVFCIVDNLCRNQIFFTYDGVKWYEGCWDVDAVLGLPPTTRGFFAYNTEFQTGYIAYKDYGMTNLLYQRVENLFTDRFKARYAELRAGVLSIENIIDVYERLTDTITTYDGLLAEDYESTTGGGKFTGIPYKNENTIQQIRTFVSQRIPYMDGVIAAMIEPVPCTGISLDRSDLTFTAEGVQTLTATVTPDGCTDPITWESDNTSVATVSGGAVTSVANGNATITAKCGEYSASCSVGITGLPENLLAAVTWDIGEVSESTGELVTTVTAARYTDFIDISEYTGKVMKMACTAGHFMYSRYALYDENFTFISAKSLGTLVIPDNAKYVRLSIYDGSGGTATMYGDTVNQWDILAVNDGSYANGVYKPDDTPSCHINIPVESGLNLGVSGGWGAFGVTEDNAVTQTYTVNSDRAGEITPIGDETYIAHCCSDSNVGNAVANWMRKVGESVVT